MSTKELAQSGYCGMLPNGNIVDRRQHPMAIPVKKNSMLGTPEPKPVAIRIHMVERSEPIDGVWSWWTVGYDTANGEDLPGEVQGDGHAMAEDTLVDEEGNPVAFCKI